MSQIISAVYENGLLRPLTPLDLTDQQTVQIQIMSHASPAQLYIQQLVDAGLVTEPAPSSDEEVLGDEERQQLADRLGNAIGNPLSEIIVKERNSW